MTSREELLRELRRHQRDYPSLVHGPLCEHAADEIERLQVNAAHWKARHDTVLQKHIECCGAPAQGAQEPVAWQFARHDGKWFNCDRAPTPEQVAEKPHLFRPLYASPLPSTEPCACLRPGGDPLGNCEECSSLPSTGLPAPAPDLYKWPVGCHSPNSCSRNGRCMYIGCRHDGADITALSQSQQDRGGK